MEITTTIRKVLRLPDNRGKKFLKQFDLSTENPTMRDMRAFNEELMVRQLRHIDMDWHESLWLHARRMQISTEWNAMILRGTFKFGKDKHNWKMLLRKAYFQNKSEGGDYRRRFADLTPFFPQ